MSESSYAAHYVAAGLNLESVIFKLSHPRGNGWTMERARRVEQEYRRWLYLNVLFPQTSLVPTEDVDEMWHTHILDTAAYASDCQIMFGKFMHHFPFAGMMGEADMLAHREHAAETGELFLWVFGRQLEGQSAECTNCDAAPFGRPRPDAENLPVHA